MNTYSGIKKKSKVDRAKQRLEIAIDRLTYIVENTPDNSLGNNTGSASTQIKYLETKNRALLKFNAKILKRMEIAVNRLKKIVED